MPTLEDEHDETVQLRAEGSVSDLEVKGLVLQPGEFWPCIEGTPQPVRITREFVLQAYDVLRRDVAAGRVLIRLAHPGLGDFPLRYGRVLAVGIDHDAARVYVTKTEVDPAWGTIMTDEARGMLYDLGFSMDGTIIFTRGPDGVREARRAVRFEGVDIVTKGAFTGKGLLRDVPENVAAKVLAGLKITAPPGTAGSPASNTNQELKGLPKLTDVNSIPEDVRTKLSPEQQAAYLSAYNEAVEAGMTPEEAHQKAATAAGALATQANDKRKNDEKEAERLKARAADADRLEQELKTIKAKAERDAAELNILKAKAGDKDAVLATLQATVAELGEKVKAAEQEKEEILVREDVKQVLAAGKDYPARRGAVETLRRKLGHADFVAHYKDAPVVVKAGELGHVPQAPPGGVTPEAEARADLERFGASAVVQAQLHVRQDAYGAEMRKLLATAKAGER